MSRCKSCDKVLESEEIIWREEIAQHEELCRKCRDAVFSYDGLEIVYVDDACAISDSLTETIKRKDKYSE